MSQDGTVLPNDLKHTKHLLRDVARELSRGLPRLNCDYEEVVSAVFKIQANLEGSAAFHIGVDRGKQQQAEKDERLIEELIKYRSYWKQRAVTAEGRLRREHTSQSEDAELDPFDTLLPKTMYAIVHGQQAAKSFTAINPAEAAGWERLSSIWQTQFRKARAERQIEQESREATLDEVRAAWAVEMAGHPGDRLRDGSPTLVGLMELLWNAGLTVVHRG